MVNGFVIALVRTERAAAPDPAQAAVQIARLQELLATGQYPRFAAALGEGGPRLPIRPPSSARSSTGSWTA